jgi:hypothetical protein
LFLTLVVTPVAYTFMDDFTVLVGRVFRRAKPTIHHEPVPQQEPIGAQHFFKRN